MKERKTKQLITMVVVLAMLMTMTTTAFATGVAPTTAVTGTTDVTIGALAIANSAAVSLDGKTKTITFAVTDMTITDARGTGAGWGVSLYASQFTNATASNGAINTLPASSLKLGTVAIAIDGTSPDSSSIDTITLGQGTIDTDTAAGVRILSAAINGGMGIYTASIGDMTLTLLPKDSKAGTYTSTITMTLTQG